MLADVGGALGCHRVAQEADDGPPVGQPDPAQTHRRGQRTEEGAEGGGGEHPALGQQAVAEVALRRADSGLWGDSVCEVVTARKQFAPTIVSPRTRLTNTEAWSQAVTIALESQRNWDLPAGERKEVVPGASHFMAHAIASPSWRNAYQVATIGDHTFLRVQSLKPKS